MKTLLMTALLVFTASKVFAMESLSDLEWKNRIVIIVGDAADEKVARQSELLAGHKVELADRDMVIIHLSRGEARTLYGPAADRDAGAIRSDLEVDGNDFHVFLIGKDGTVKLMRDDLVSDTEIFGLIDAMPMRRAEKG